MTKLSSTKKQTRRQFMSPFCQEALKIAERIGVAATAREFSGWYAWHLRRHQISWRQRFRLVCNYAV